MILNAGMSHQVIPESAVDDKALATNVAWIGQLLTRVLVHVLLESCGTTENCVAFRAGKVA